MATLTTLPPEVLQLIFKCLDLPSILAVSETCRNFNSIVSDNDSLTKRLSLYMRFPQDLIGFKESIMSSNRRYRSLVIVTVKSRDHAANAYRATVAPLFEHLGQMIRDLKIDWSNALRPREASLFDMMNRRRGGLVAQARRAHADHFFDDVEAAQGLALARTDMYKEFVSIISHFTNLETLSLCNVHLERERPATEPAIQYSRLRNVLMKQCDSFCFDLLSSCTQLTRLMIIAPWFNSRVPGIVTFEEFLINQRVLRDLRLINVEYPIFLSDRSENIAFKLETLILRNVYFANQHNAERFFRTQAELKSIELQLKNGKIRMLDEIMFYNGMLRTIVTNCPRLESINITKIQYKLTDLSFISHIRNANVKTLMFRVTSEDNSSNLFKTFVQMFPNLKEINFKAEESEDTDCGICFDEGNFEKKT